MKKSPRIVFFGTPEFAVASLEALVREGYNITAVVTAPDRQAGRGLQISSSPVKKYALQQNLRLLQPENLKDPSFLQQLRSLQPDLQVVVAFRMMPRDVWALPPLGTFNLHASLLPQYRGAAPINWVIINGEKETGVTTFFLDDKIDTGKIIFANKMTIGETDTAGELHNRLMEEGARLVVTTVENILNKSIRIIPQDQLMQPDLILKKAPKIHPSDCTIEWHRRVIDIYNLIRGLNPYPGAHTSLKSTEGSSYYLKIYRATMEIAQHSNEPGRILTDGKSYFKIAAADGYINPEEIQPAGRKTMQAGDFMRGFGRQFA
jgi:methionyl-tRNA formyltransferase